MYHYIKYYTIPLIAASVTVGILCMVVVGGDAVFGEASPIPRNTATPAVGSSASSGIAHANFTPSEPDLGFGSSTQDFLGLGNLLSSGFACDFITARNGSSWTDYIGAVIRFMVSGYGTVAAHELTHRIKNRIAMLKGRSPFSISCMQIFPLNTFMITM